MNIDPEKLKEDIQNRNKEIKELRNQLKTKKKGRPKKSEQEKRYKITEKINDLLRLNREDKKKIERNDKFRDKTNYKTNKQRDCKRRDEVKDSFEKKREEYNVSDNVGELKVQEGCIDEYGNLVKPLIDIDVFADRTRFNMSKARPESVENKMNFLKEYLISFGNNALAANRVGKDPDSIYKWLKADKYFEMLYLEIKNVLLDFAEMRLYQLVNVGDLKAIEFFLKTKGKERGYTEKIENENTYKDDTININIISPDDDKNDDDE